MPSKRPSVNSATRLVDGSLRAARASRGYRVRPRAARGVPGDPANCRSRRSAPIRIGTSKTTNRSDDRYRFDPRRAAIVRSNRPAVSSPSRTVPRQMLGRRSPSRRRPASKASLRRQSRPHRAGCASPGRRPRRRRPGNAHRRPWVQPAGRRVGDSASQCACTVVRDEVRDDCGEHVPIVSAANREGGEHAASDRGTEDRWGLAGDGRAAAVQDPGRGRGSPRAVCSNSPAAASSSSRDATG